MHQAVSLKYQASHYVRKLTTFSATWPVCACGAESAKVLDQMADEEAAAEQRLPEDPQDILTMRWLTPRDRAIIRAASQGATAFPDHYQESMGPTKSTASTRSINGAHGIPVIGPS